MSLNPFFELYAGDRISPDDFVKMFSDVLVPHAVPIFAPGNAVVTGKQGSGKSMLLSLLRPEIRLQYHEAREEFPVPPDMRSFLSATVNLAHSVAIDFGLRRASDLEPEDIQLYFADFLNYLILRSLISCLKIYAFADDEIRKEVGLNLKGDECNRIIPALSSHPVWEGWIEPCETIEEFDNQLQNRIRGYRRYLHKKVREIDPDYLTTRTAIGEPALAFSEVLRSEDAIAKKTHIFIDIDQYEELANILNDKVEGQTVDYRATINKALANRNQFKVSYRIGTRGHAWRNHSKIMGTTAKLEEERDYKYVELDEILTRRENSKSHIFPKFARDVFNRRMIFAKFNVDLDEDNAIDDVYVKSFTPDEKIERLSLRKPQKALKFDKNFSLSTKNRLIKLAKNNLLSAKLGEIWVRQKGDVENLDVLDSELPWEKKKYWKKERREVALLQIASDSQQKPLWCGANDVIALSGGNILVFLSLNQFIWDTWILYKGKDSETRLSLPMIDVHVQSLGVQKASKYWIEKITQETGMSSERSRFVATIAGFFNKKLFADKKISYPGHTGFSIQKSELFEYPNVREYLEELVDYGNLLMLDHTTKNKDRKQRVKFYLNPIFCPHFGIPFIRTKEPYYSPLIEVVSWLSESGYSVSFNKDANVRPQRLV